MLTSIKKPLRKVARKSNTKNLIKKVEGTNIAFCGAEQFFGLYGQTIDHVTAPEVKASTRVRFDLGDGEKDDWVVLDKEDDEWVDLGEENHTIRQPVPAHVRPSKSCLKTSSPTTVAELEK